MLETIWKIARIGSVFTKNAVDSELHESHILFAMQMLNKANTEWARSCEIIDDCELLHYSIIYYFDDIDLHVWVVDA